MKRRGASQVVIGAVALALLTGCGSPPRPARTSAAEPERPRERAARERHAHRRCSPYWGFLYPGLGHVCLRQDAEGGALMGVATAEGAGLVAGVVTKKSSVTWATSIALQDAYVYGAIAPVLDFQLAQRRRFVPEDTLGELLFAPFNGRVLSRPDVWGGIVGMSAAGIAASVLLLDRERQYHPGGTPSLFGRSVPPGLSYPAAGLTYGALFSHVAIAEETAFRGFVQSGLSRACGEGCGWALGSFAFGLFHATNAFQITDGRQRARYLAIGVPYLVLTGQLLGGSYWLNRYSLAPPVAIHFWYDLILSVVDFALDPRQSPISARIGFPF